MDAAAVLKVQVAIDGLAKTKAQLAAIDGDLHKVAGSAEGAGGGFDKVSSTARDVDRDVGRARRAVSGMSGDMRDADRHGTRLSRTFGGLAAAAGGAGGALGGIGGGLGFMGSTIAAALPVVIAFSASLVAVTAALGPLVGLAAAAGAGLAAAAQGFGVFKLATMGVVDALKEHATAQTGAAGRAISTANAQRAAAQQITAAQDGVRSAHEQVRSAVERLASAEDAARVAEKGLTVARVEAGRALQDMHASLNDAILTEQRAIIGLQDARAALAQTIAGTSPEDLAKAQQAVTEAAHGQEQAVLALNTAQENYNAIVGDATSTDAQRAQALADLHAAQDGVTRAAFSATDAQDALNKAQAGPTDEDKRKALLAVKEAQNALTDATRDRARQQADTNAADKAGIAGSQQVLAAQQAIKQASQQVADTQRALTSANIGVTRATQAVRDAQLNASSSSAAAAAASGKLQSKMDALPPAAQTFTRALIAMKPKLDSLRQTAAAGFFPGATKGLNAASRSFGAVQTVIGRTARVLGDFTRKLGELVGSTQFSSDIETIGTRNAKVLETMGEATRHVISALRNVLVAAGPLTQWLADVANKWSLNASEAAKAGRESGKLAAFFERTRAVAERLGSILGHLAKGLLGIGHVGQVSGNQILVSIDRASARFDEWANSVRGQRSIQSFFQDAKDLAAQLVPVMASVAGSVALLAIRTAPLTEALQLLRPIVPELTVAFVAYKLAATAAAFSSVVLKGAAVGLRIAAVASIASTNLLTSAFWGLNAALDANPIGVVIIALAALAAGLVFAYKHSETFRDIVDGTWRALKDAASAIFPTIVDIITTAWTVIKAVTTTAWAAISALIVTPIRAARDTVGEVVTGIYNRISAGWTTITGATSAAWGAVRDAILGALRAARDAISEVVTGIANRLTAGWESIKFAASVAWDAVRGFILEPVRSARDALVDVMAGIVSRVQAGWDAVLGGVKHFADDVKDKISDAFKGAANLVIGFVNEIIKAINLIPGVPNIDLIKKLAEGGVNGPAPKPGGFAHGGAFARTGGLVGSPITLMGEEAPRHPEFVIPTNPAYRSRAQMLLAQAAGAIGMATGGRYSVGDMARLAASVDASQPNVMGAIGMAESSGNPAAHGPPDGRGLWQIEWPVWARTMTSHGLNNAYDADQNARMMKIVQTAQGLSAWVTYNTGAYKQFLGGGGGGGIVGAITGAVSAVGGVLGDLLSKGASFLLDKLPGVGDLPDWLKGTGKYVLDKAGDWIKDKVSELVGADGSGSPGPPGGPDGVSVYKGVQIADWVIGALKYAEAKGVDVRPTSGYRPGFDPHTASGKSEHQGTRYPHGAVDFGGYNTGLAMKMAVVNATRDYKYPLLAPKGFHDDGHASGTGHKMGGIYGVLGSYANGTDWVPETGPYMLHRGEAVTPAGGATVDDLIDALRDMDVTFMVGGQVIDEKVEIVVDRRERATRGAWNAGRVA